VFLKFALPVSVSAPGFAVPGVFHTYGWFNGAIPFSGTIPTGLNRTLAALAELFETFRLVHLDPMLGSSHHREESRNARQTGVDGLVELTELDKRKVYRLNSMILVRLLKDDGEKNSW
jgi:hypothetical protein